MAMELSSKSSYTSMGIKQSSSLTLAMHVCMYVCMYVVRVWGRGDALRVFANIFFKEKIRKLQLDDLNKVI